MPREIYFKMKQACLPLNKRNDAMQRMICLDPRADIRSRAFAKNYVNCSSPVSRVECTRKVHSPLMGAPFSSWVSSSQSSVSAPRIAKSLALISASLRHAVSVRKGSQTRISTARRQVSVSRTTCNEGRGCHKVVVSFQGSFPGEARDAWKSLDKKRRDPPAVRQR